MIAKALRVLHLFENLTLAFSFLTMLVLAVMQIALRNFFDGGFLWAESFVRVLVLWIAILGALVATRQNNHISIAFLKLASLFNFR